MSESAWATSYRNLKADYDKLLKEYERLQKHRRKILEENERVLNALIQKDREIAKLKKQVSDAGWQRDFDREELQHNRRNEWR